MLLYCAAHAVMFFVVFEDLWLWFGTRRRARSVKTYDTGSRNTVLPCTRDSDGSASLFSRSWCMECGLHFWRTVGKTYPVPGAKSSPAGMLYMAQECVCFSTIVLHSTGLCLFQHVSCTFHRNVFQQVSSAFHRNVSVSAGEFHVPHECVSAG